MGVVLFVETAAAGDVTGFTLKAQDETYDVAIAEDVEYGFDLKHLNEHMATGDPVRCKLEERDGDLYALTIEDAPKSAS